MKEKIDSNSSSLKWEQNGGTGDLIAVSGSVMLANGTPVSIKSFK